jgi:hypothetical protein
VTCACGRPDSEHATVLYSGGPDALPESRTEAAVKARKLTPAVRDAPEPTKPAQTRSGGGTTVRRRTAKEAAQISAWRKMAEQRGKRA